MELLPGVRSHTLTTERMRTHYLESGPEDGVPVVLVHGNLSTARFFEHLLPDAPERYRFVVPDMRGFGDSEPLPLDATRGLGDWADDVSALVTALGIDEPVHLLGWSTGGAAIVAYAQQRPVASLTFIDPVSPYGYGGVKPDGTPCAEDYAGSGGGTANPEVVERLRAGDRSAESPLSPRNVLNSLYWPPTHRLPQEREDLLVEEMLKTSLGDDGYPGDATASPNWPGVAPGTRGLLNALSPKHCSWTGIVELDPKPPVLWTHGTADLVVSDASPLDFGVLGAAGQVPGWPGEEDFPPQPMVAQIRAVLERYADAGGEVRMELLDGAGHAPHFDAQQPWSELFFGFLADASKA